MLAQKMAGKQKVLPVYWNIRITVLYIDVFQNVTSEEFMLVDMTFHL